MTVTIRWLNLFEKPLRLSIMGWYFAEVRVCVHSSQNLAFLVLPGHWQTDWSDWLIRHCFVGASSRDTPCRTSASKCRAVADR